MNYETEIHNGNNGMLTIYLYEVAAKRGWKEFKLVGAFEYDLNIKTFRVLDFDKPQ